MNGTLVWPRFRYADAAVAATPPPLRAPGSNVLWFIATDRARNQEYLKEVWADPSRTLAVVGASCVWLLAWFVAGRGGVVCGLGHATVNIV